MLHRRIPVHLTGSVMIALFVTLVSGLFSASTDVVHADGPFKAEIFRISGPPGEKLNPAIHDGLVVWQDKRGGDWDIYGFDLQGNREFVISSAVGDQVAPRIFRPWVVWADNRNGNWDIYAFNLDSREELRLTTDPSHQEMPSIWGTTVIWRDKRNWVNDYEGSYDLYGYDLVSRREFPVVVTPITDETAPQIWGRRVAYRAAGLHGIKFNVIGVVSVYHLDQKSAVELKPPEPMPSYGFSLSGDRIAWVKGFPPPGALLCCRPEMYVTNLATGEDVNLVEPFLPTDPHMDGSLLVWSVFQGSEQDGIWLYDTESRIRSYLIRDRVIAASLSGNVVIWLDTLDVAKGRYRGLSGARIVRQLDWQVPNGHFYTQARGEAPAGTGYAVTNDPQALFWAELQRLGGVPALGYPASRRFIWDGFTSQVMQKQVFQWRPEVEKVYFVNVFDELSKAGKDDWLLAYRQVPKSFDWSADAGLPWSEIVQRHLKLLDSNPAIKARYLADPDPIAHFGLPMAYGEYENVFVLRGQRAVLQQWRVDTPWAKAGQVTVANGGDILKETGLIPREAIVPESPPQ
ncbi:MAG: hypothetical protein M1136_08945 [Chloroflexi bacterium]|nr:hypothetical protein [Chloroflexota bacterium]